MINLLSPEMKKQMRAARTNVTLYHYCLLLLSTALLLGAVFAVGFWANYNTLHMAQSAKADTDAQAQAYAKTRAAAEDFAKNLTSAKTILASNTNFTELVLDIASLVPSGVVLNNLTLGTNNAASNAPITISGRATSYDGAINLKNSLDASPIFENVSIVSVSQSDTSIPGQTSALVQRYPFSLNLAAHFTKKATGTTK